MSCFGKFKSLEDETCNECRVVNSCIRKTSLGRKERIIFNAEEHYNKKKQERKLASKWVDIEEQ